MTPATVTSPRPDLWVAAAARPRRRPDAPPTLLPQAPPVPLQDQLAALQGELRAWGREALL